MSKPSVALTAGLLVLSTRVLSAQVLTGTLFGTVRDEAGGVLPAAIVRVSSPALIGGPATAVSDERGQFRLPALAPGEYTLEVERARFAPYRGDRIRITVGAAVERTVILRLAGPAESIAVEGKGSAVDTRRSGLSSHYGPEQLATIPVRRYSMFDFIKATPGVSPTSPSSGTNNNVSVFGGSANENLYLLDGTNFT
ncbi:MAG TPA: carboxypeptidase-like regulatory domain-containing protein [Candidatus Dormibacteraeota bacterium]